MNRLDRILCEIDTGLRTVFAVPHAARAPRTRREPDGIPAEPLTQDSKNRSIRLMRINHCGEVCAQALYQGQALVAHDAQIRETLLEAAGEERDHLAWCSKRLAELGGSVSVATPAFYAGAFSLGVLSGLAGDQWSMGFLRETERQVEAHLDEHLERIGDDDDISRDILESMREDEIRHGQTALEHGARELPPPVRSAMRAFSRVMTRTTYWV